MVKIKKTAMALLEREGSTARFDASNYPNLQNLMRKDPASYEQEFRRQYKLFESSLELLELQGGQGSIEGTFCQLVTFLSHVLYCYPKEGAAFPMKLMALLRKSLVLATISASTGVPVNRADGHQELRMTLVKNLILLKHRGVMQKHLTELYSLFFDVLGSHDKALRSMIYGFLLKDIQMANKPSKNEKLNRVLGAFLAKLWITTKEVAASESEPAVKLLGRERLEKLALRLTIELYHKGVWTHGKTINAIALACLSPNPKVSIQGLAFFAGKKPKSCKSKPEAASDDSDDEQQYVAEGDETRVPTAFAPYLLLNDPQGFVERLFFILKHAGESYTHRTLMMSVISRLISFHKLLLTPFYSYLLRFLRPNQRDITHILSFAAQSVHEHVSLDALQELTATIMKYFVAEYCSNEIITVGLNTLRAIAARNAAALDAIQLGFILNFKGYKNKGVVMATRSIIALYRDVVPHLLPKRERGKAATLSAIEEKRSLKLMAEHHDTHAEPKTTLIAQEALSHADSDEEAQSLSFSSSTSWEECSDDDDDQDMDSDSDFIDVSNDEEDDGSNEADVDNKDNYDKAKDTTEMALDSGGDIIDHHALEAGEPSDDDPSDEEESSSEDETFISPYSITAGIKVKRTAEQKLAESNLKKQERKEKFSFKKKKLANGGGSSNQEKKKTKSFMMLRHKRGGRLARKKPTLKEKRVALKQQGRKRKR